MNFAMMLENSVGSRPKQPGAASRLLSAVFAALDEAGVAYCVLHGYEEYPASIKSDVDMVLDPAMSSRSFADLVTRAAAPLGASIARRAGYHLILAAGEDSGSRQFLTLDASTSSELFGRRYYSADEVLQGRRRYGSFYVPSREIEFGSYLAMTMTKGKLDGRREARLSQLYAMNPAGCERQIRRFWRGAEAELLTAAARSGDWARVQDSVDQLDTSLEAVTRPWPARLGQALERGARVLGRLINPPGITAVVLGPDGAGKSSTTDAVGGPDLLPIFDRSICLGFAPPLHRLAGRNDGPSKEPHALPPRSAMMSVAKAMYWLAYGLAAQVQIRLAVARNTLVLFDRHFVDILVDAKRYRYNGPTWLPQLIWRVLPKPDLVILLDAPAEVLQSRKQEVPFEVTLQQAAAYRQLVGALPFGRVVDASAPFPEVVAAVNDLLLKATQHRR